MKGRRPQGGERTAPVRSAARGRSERAERESASKIGVKRVYDEASRDDGVRIIIDRLWPRGVSKAALKFDAWPRDLAPSSELRKWYGHEPERFAEFSRRYRAELAARGAELGALRAQIKGRVATLLTATRELDVSHAKVLREVLERPPK